MTDVVIFGTGIDGRRIYRYEKKRNKSGENYKKTYIMNTLNY